jgi:protein SCO1/2
MRPFAAIVLASILAAPLSARGQDSPSTLIRKVGFDQNLDAQVPLDLPFRDEAGKTVRLGDYFGQRPVILTLVYYECPMLCNEVLNGFVRSLRGMSLDAGRDFEIVTVSIDPGEKPALAAAKKRGYLARYRRPGAEHGWHFLTGDESSIRRLTQTVGFRYVYDPKSDQYAHPAGITILTPKGKVSRYLYGIEYPVRFIRLGLSEASAGKVGSPVDQILLLCFHYDPATGKYNFAIMSVVRLLGLLTLGSLATFMFIMFRRDRLRAKQTGLALDGV